MNQSWAAGRDSVITQSSAIKHDSGQYAVITWNTAVRHDFHDDTDVLERSS